MSNTKTVVLISGGLDSSALLGHLLWSSECIGLSLDYGQRHKPELNAAREIAAHFKIPHHVFDIPIDKIAAGSGSALIHEAEVPDDPERAGLTVVPGRNLIMLAVAASLAIANRCGRVAVATHQDDHLVYPDCRPKFVDALRGTLAAVDDEPIELLVPFVDTPKAEIVRIGAACGVPLERTWSCYNGRERQCGKCPSCLKRREAFAAAGVPDLTDYEV